jgi:hypothetical protein
VFLVKNERDRVSEISCSVHNVYTLCVFLRRALDLYLSEKQQLFSLRLIQSLVIPSVGGKLRDFRMSEKHGESRLLALVSLKANSHMPYRAPAMPYRVNSHMPCRAPAILWQCRVHRESPRGSREYPNC